MRRLRIRSRLVPAIALGVIAAVVLTIVVGLALNEGDEKALDIRGGGAAQRLYGGIEQEGASLGDRDAEISISIYNDLQCRSCASWHLRTVPVLVEKLARTGRVRLVYHHFAMGQRQRQAGFYAAAAAALQGREWQYIHVFFANQEVAMHYGVTEEFMTKVAEDVPHLDIQQWRADRKDFELERSLDADLNLARDLGLPARPAAIVDGPEGRRQLVDAPAIAAIEAAVTAVSQKG